MWRTIKQVTAQALGRMAISTFIVLVVNVLLGVFTRKFLGDQWMWTEELARFLLVWVSFLGGAIAYLDDKHLGVDILASHFQKDARRINKIVIHVIVLAFALFVMGIGGSQWVVNRWESGQILPALGISKAWFYLAVPVSGFLISIFALGNVVAFLAGIPEEPETGEEKTLS